jgi:Kef-type K+ transport system membrane component KefB
MAAVVGKLSCAGGVWSRGVQRWIVAAGMIPRGEVTLVFATLGSSIRFGQSPLLDERAYTALVAVVLLTTLVTPPVLKWSLSVGAGVGGVTRPAA